MDYKNCIINKRWFNGDVSVVDCSTCGFVHQYPTPKLNDVLNFYTNEYYEEIKPKYLEDIKKEEKNRVMWATDKYEIFTSNLDSSHNKKRRILDVGASFGTFLNYFQSRGWQCVGVEPSKYAAQIAVEIYDLDIHNDFLENLSLKKLGGKFDVVHIQETIDHLTDPACFVRRCANELLKNGGLLCIETANQFNEFQMATVKTSGCPMWWIVSDHISYFNRTTLTNLVLRNGFDVVDEISTFPMEIFPLMGDNFVTDPQIGTSCHEKRLFFEDLLSDGGLNKVRMKFYRTLAKSGFGRGIINVSKLR